MLSIKIKRDSINKECTQIFVDDITGNYGELIYVLQPDGTYLQQTNTWGWGAPNLERASHALIWLLERRTGAGKLWEYPAPYNPLDGAVQLVNLPYTEDGHLIIHAFAVPNFNAATVYAAGAITFAPDVNALPYQGTIQRFNGTIWEAVSPEAALLEIRDYKAEKSDFLTLKTRRNQSLVNDRINRHLMGIQACVNVREWKEMRTLAQTMRGSAHAAYCNGYPIPAVEILEGLLIRFTQFLQANVV